MAINGLRRCPMITSKRLSYQPLRERDQKAILDYLSDYETVYFLTYGGWPYTSDELAVWYNYVDTLCERGAASFWGIHDADDTFIGVIGLSIFREHDRAEVHFWIGRPYWGKGYGTEALRRIMSYGFETLALERLEVNHMAKNIRSQRVIEKNGFRYEGLFREYVKRFGQYEDLKFYSLLKTEYHRQQGIVS